MNCCERSLNLQLGGAAPSGRAAGAQPSQLQGRARDCWEKGFPHFTSISCQRWESVGTGTGPFPSWEAEVQRGQGTHPYTQPSTSLPHAKTRGHHIRGESRHRGMKGRAGAQERSPRQAKTSLRPSLCPSPPHLQPRQQQAAVYGQLPRLGLRSVPEMPPSVGPAFYLF